MKRVVGKVLGFREEDGVAPNKEYPMGLDNNWHVNKDKVFPALALSRVEQEIYDAWRIYGRGNNKGQLKIINFLCKRLGLNKPKVSASKSAKARASKSADPNKKKEQLEAMF